MSNSLTPGFDGVDHVALGDVLQVVGEVGHEHHAVLVAVVVAAVAPTEVAVGGEVGEGHVVVELVGEAAEEVVAAG